MPTQENLLHFLVTNGNGVNGLSKLNLKKIPKEFIQPPRERFHNTEIVKGKNIPTIDLNDPGAAQSICKAASEWGFFQIINHGIPLEVMDGAKDAAHCFFDLPVEERTKYLKENSPTDTVMLKTSFSPSAEQFMDWKDHLVHFVDGRRNVDVDLVEDYKLWPHVSRDKVLRYVKHAKPLIRNLLEVLLRGLNVPKMDEAKEDALMGTVAVSLVHYPVCPNPDLAVGSGRHSDVSSITLLLQDDVGGLYIRDGEADRWIHAEPMRGSLVVNIGDSLQIMSNGRYKSIEHRVFLTGNTKRVSVPIFANALSDVLIGPLPQVLEAGDKPIYKQVRFADYFDHFLSKGQDGKAAINFAKI